MQFGPMKLDVNLELKWHLGTGDTLGYASSWEQMSIPRLGIQHMKEKRSVTQIFMLLSDEEEIGKKIEKERSAGGQAEG